MVDCDSIEILGIRLLSIPNSWYWASFVTFDMVALAIQTVGGVEVSSAQDLQAANHGGNVMRAGIIFQFSNTALFTMLLLAAQIRMRQRGMPISKSVGRPAILVLWTSTLMLLLRNGYRIVELSQGWNGHVMRTENYLIGLDMAPMALAIGVFVVFPPSIFLKTRKLSGVEVSADSSSGIPLQNAPQFKAEAC